MDAALKLEGVGKRYGAFEAVSDLSFEARAGRICGFLGPNGAGKTSTIRMIVGLITPRRTDHHAWMHRRPRGALAHRLSP